jgi:hypothetical protein
MHQQLLGRVVQGLMPHVRRFSSRDAAGFSRNTKVLFSSGAVAATLASLTFGARALSESKSTTASDPKSEPKEQPTGRGPLVDISHLQKYDGNWDGRQVIPMHVSTHMSISCTTTTLMYAHCVHVSTNFMSVLCNWASPLHMMNFFGRHWQISQTDGVLS